MRDIQFVNSLGNPCTAAQFLTEMMCKRQAKKQSLVLDSTTDWWNSPVWKKIYGRQIAVAHGLLKLFEFETICEALNSKDGSWIFSLSYKGLIEIIRVCDEKRKNKAIVEKAKDEPISFEQTAVEEIKEIRLRSRKNKLEGLE